MSSFVYHLDWLKNSHSQTFLLRGKDMATTVGLDVIILAPSHCGLDKLKALHVAEWIAIAIIAATPLNNYRSRFYLNQAMN